MIDVRYQDNIAIVTLNRPDKMNALNIELFEAIDKVSKQLRKNRQIRAIILTGSGNNFCAGIDIKSALGSKTAAIKLLFKWWPGQANLAQRVSHNWRTIPVPVIAAIEGHCLGGGVQLILGADFRIANHNAQFSVMEGKWGIIPDMSGNMGLAQLMPKDQALKLVMSAETFDAKQALQYGLLTELDDKPLQRAIEFAQSLCQRSPDTLAASKKLYHKSWTDKPWRWLMRESWYQIKILLAKNQRIAVKRQQSIDKGEQASRDFVPRQRW
ncbi:crotonase/enoyl-CoA hydratase family protein [Thalassotalea sp. HSM 43]|uniref:crotonase/enoyl-CoA hydratase family protein n=1 Tax=Thalassotalea sp. HSM 43 TaxID=2552945 RepID=UPI001081DF59|nr:crotonase/enoyl-CoA hydratase family protein [Thalassotalea sp. HSM 43]QBY04958.1 crotonase/enoyl-CoA hydratase family protein [Thalassotalea sp. HSM 43]